MEKSKIQAAYEYCHAIFSQQGLPTFQRIQHLKNILDSMEAKDVGIDEFGSCDSAISLQEAGGSRGLLCGRGFSEITYIHIHECDSFSIGVFCLPAGKTFPLHDHPGMIVLSKLLYGSVYVKAYDWIKVDNRASQRRKCNYYSLHSAQIKQALRIVVDAAVGLAGRVVDGIMKAPQETSILFPTRGGNIHGFTALTPCAILDVLSPQYSEELGRPSTYFSDSPFPSPSSDYALLEAILLPADLVVRAAPYLGPPVSPQYCSYQCTLCWVAWSCFAVLPRLKENGKLLPKISLLLI
ncbi:plant cysteine oxidase 4-like isoform X1 [Prosopis cineraria]|uniref:plant cysteine oxidase 4-like isoform X1 n=1 Tax=Prosopis cineraria TaxID=364024 RepID=UPI00240F7F28|nr:plant cysteine oxidase 4-like isoform X1 [Prosopis cineraria]